MTSESAFGVDVPQDSPGLLLWQTTVLWQRLIKKKLDAFDISHGQFVILAILLWLEEHGEKPTQAAISRLSKLDKMTVSKALKKLASEGLVKRAENEADTRAKDAALTPQGQKLACLLVPIVEQIDEDFFSSLSASDQTSLISILRQLT